MWLIPRFIWASVIVMTAAGCASDGASPLRAAEAPSPGSAYVVAPTNMASLFLDGDTVRGVTGLDVSTVPVIEGAPDKRGLVRPGLPCGVMIAGKHDASVFGDKYLGYRHVGYSQVLGARTFQTIALYPSITEAGEVFNGVVKAADECRLSGAGHGIIEFDNSTPSEQAWTYRTPAATGEADLCAVDARTTANLVLVVEVCHTANEASQAQLIADAIFAKVHTA
ncbi:hypothetical protein M2272_003053 [Mycobacterium frederiksbergense]|uniref:PknH-like extracellular domain-containing protein n=1 Tax=Mycolicibacterium frederiksbergense TaxID=117567 RepID=A0ABT6L0D5_9MYCO|nr:sensor domain-containing protein [Mycolicibacterium frederiksbergense]MDH6196410.1 hypothetical protein [Mycolicibacterium frederiksbergense]